jgi:hypothetical protein
MYLLLKYLLQSAAALHPVLNTRQIWALGRTAYGCRAGRCLHVLAVSTSVLLLTGWWCSSAVQIRFLE